MNKNEEVCVVIRDSKNEVTGVLVSQVHIHAHILYKTSKMGIEEIFTALEPQMIKTKKE